MQKTSPDTRGWAKVKEAALAMRPGIDRSMISKVESGEKLMPSRWIGMLSGSKKCDLDDESYQPPKYVTCICA